MTRDQIIALAREAGLALAYTEPDEDGWQELERFAALVAAHEREECAKVCERMWHEWLDSPEENEPNKPDAEDCYRAIRRRT